MILFASGRCDIPAFYSAWFFQRLKEGYVDVRNPYDPHQLSRIMLTDKVIDCIVFCTKDPLFMIDRLSEIPFPFLFHITVTAYHKEIEAGLRHTKQQIIQGVKQLSQMIGKQRVIVRYDPILLTPRYTPAYHEKAFAALCAQLDGFVDTYIISFVDLYKNTQKHAKGICLQKMDEASMWEIGKRLGLVAKRYAVQVQTCAEQIDLSMYGIGSRPCFEREDLRRRLGDTLRFPIGRSVRSQCSCLPTVDIGDYNACAHFCAYCYANYDEKRIRERMRLHDPRSSVLLGQIQEADRITVRKDGRKS